MNDPTIIKPELERRENGKRYEGEEYLLLILEKIRTKKIKRVAKIIEHLDDIATIFNHYEEPDLKANAIAKKRYTLHRNLSSLLVFIITTLQNNHQCFSKYSNVYLFDIEYDYLMTLYYVLYNLLYSKKWSAFYPWRFSVSNNFSFFSIQFFTTAFMNLTTFSDIEIPNALDLKGAEQPCIYALLDDRDLVEYLEKVRHTKEVYDTIVLPYEDFCANLENYIKQDDNHYEYIKR